MSLTKLKQDVSQLNFFLGDLREIPFLYLFQYE